MKRIELSFLALALIVSVMFAYFAIVRDRDLHRIACDIINRQVSGSAWQVESGRLFRDNSRSPEIRAFYQVNVPERIDALDRAQSDQHRLHCLKEDK